LRIVRAARWHCVLKTHVVRVCFKCFRCFIWTLQVFHVDVAKVDRDVAYVALVLTYVASYCFQCFGYFSRRMFQMCLFECCICFTYMLQVFYLDVA
jgi:hypothetical protein